MGRAISLRSVVFGHAIQTLSLDTFLGFLNPFLLCSTGMLHVTLQKIKHWDITWEIMPKRMKTTKKNINVEILNQTGMSIICI